MKSIDDYVRLEPDFYRQVIKNYDSLFLNKLPEITIQDIDNIVIYATGSSSNAAYGALPFMSKVLELPVHIEEPSISENYMMSLNKHTLYIAISQGGA